MILRKFFFNFLKNSCKSKFRSYLIPFALVFSTSHFFQILKVNSNPLFENNHSQKNKNINWIISPGITKDKIWFRDNQDNSSIIFKKRIRPEKVLNEINIKAIGRAVTVNDYPYPEISNYVPNAFVDNSQRTFTISTRGISKNRFCKGKNFSSKCSDAILDLDYSLFSNNNISFSPKITIQSVTNRGTKFGEASSLGFKFAKEFTPKWSLAIGGENIIHFDEKSDLGRNFYFIGSTFYTLNNNENPAILFLNMGIGSDFYGYRGNGIFGKTKCFGTPNLTGRGSNECSWGPIGSIAYTFNDKYSINSEWFGYGYGLGLSYKPLKDRPISFSFYTTDFIKGFPKYIDNSFGEYGGCPETSCSRRYYGSISVSF